MMGTKKLTEIIIETERVLVVGGNQQPVNADCPACRTAVEMLTPEQAAAIVSVPPRTIYRWVEAELLHFIEQENGLLLICRNSLYGKRGEQQIDPGRCFSPLVSGST